ncbi:hypothetical protein B0H13DRAFT_2303749 [Mycena leptocephala]|nr:hypothetical protein B0H13DRAFT_2303749 [Mycena leptocephala]
MPFPNRLVVNHKFGEFSLNSMIPREAIAGARLDTLKNLGDHILKLRRVHGPTERLVVWKSDVCQAYRRLPMNIFWQLKQVVTIVVTIDGRRHTDRRNNFGTTHGVVLLVQDAILHATKHPSRASALHFVERLPSVCWPPNVPPRGTRISDRRKRSPNAPVEGEGGQSLGFMLSLRLPAEGK